MKSLAERLAATPKTEREAILSALTAPQAEALLYDWRGFHARENQIAPEGDWDIWLVLAGRGFGKTRTGAEWVRERVAAGARRIAIIGETAADTRQVMVEGESGLLACHPPAERPIYEPSKREVTWPNGAKAILFNATEPDQLRGPQFDTAWSDELAKWRYARETWDQLQFGLRIERHGLRPQQIVTTTPRPIELIKAILAGKEGRAETTRGRTMDNMSNLAPSFLRKVFDRYEGTRMGRQELEAEILSDLPGALWSAETLDAYRLKDRPADMGRIVVAIDPAVTSHEASDEHGIIVAGLRGSEGIILDDRSCSGGPLEWARAAVAAYDEHGADGVVVEVNQGGDMVAHTLRTVRDTLPIIEVRATRGKHVRAEPIAALYQQGRVRHVGGFPELEAQMTSMTASGYEGAGSPDRVDAMVWALTELFPGMVERTPDVARFAMPVGRGWMA